MMNSLNIEMIQEILDVFKRINENIDEINCKCLIITGQEQFAFCSGAQIQGPPSSSENEAKADQLKEQISIGDIVGDRMENYFNKLILELYNLNVPTVCCVANQIAGGGIGLALCCDFCLCVDDCEFLLTFLPNLGIVPDLGTLYFLTRILGRSRTIALTFLGEKLYGEEAASLGVVYKSFKTYKAMKATSVEIAKKLCLGPTLTYKPARQLIDKSYSNSLKKQLNDEKETQQILTNYPDFIIGVTSFLNKKKPKFTGIKKIEIPALFKNSKL